MTLLTDKAAKVTNQWVNCQKVMVTHRIYINDSPEHLQTLIDRNNSRAISNHSYIFRYQKTVDVPQVRTVKHGSRSFRSTAAKI